MKGKQVLSVLLTGAVSTVLLLGVLFLSGCHHRTPDQRADRFIDCIAGKLDLDADQKQHLTGLKAELMARRSKMRAERQVFRDELIAQVKSDTFDSSEIEKMVAGKLAMADEIAALVTRRLVAFHATLRPEQKEKLAEMIEDFADCHERFHNG